ncbi:MAG TPA: lipopolysaccharide assembly protein LapB [Coxiellaceae bacterium]|nr:lipopolysaccharide assembly protein LapB [Coxiellaceae bacterium]
MVISPVSLVLLLLPIAAASGWLAGRKTVPAKLSKRESKLHSAYFVGLNYLLNEEPDKALDVFLKLVKVDTETIETHLALGSLFRRKGEVDRATRIHQNIVTRNLDPKLRVKALFELAQDYLSAGVLDRAERLFLELVEMGQNTAVNLKHLLHIYQQEKDWPQAIQIAQRLQRIAKISMNAVTAQHYCELTEKMRHQNQLSQAYHYLKLAQSIDPNCVRSSLIRGELAMAAENYEEAIRAFQLVEKQDPSYLTEIIVPLRHCYKAMNNEAGLVERLEYYLSRYPRMSFIVALAKYRQHQISEEGKIQEVVEYIQKALIQPLTHVHMSYRCGQCSYSWQRLYWLCPSCHTWNSVKPMEALEHALFGKNKEKIPVLTL